MQALVRVQARVRARRVRMSEEGQAVQRQLFYRRQQESRPRRSMVSEISLPKKMIFAPCNTHFTYVETLNSNQH